VKNRPVGPESFCKKAEKGGKDERDSFGGQRLVSLFSRKAPPPGVRRGAKRKEEGARRTAETL
jgi:hypothetical protein